MVSTGHFAHNKFVVFCDSDGKPRRVLTGSTNWTSSGLCTQANNGLIIDDADVAADFLDAWNRIKAAGNDYPPALVNGNSTAKTFQIDGCRVTPWFVKTSAAQDLDYARKLINAARDGILFLFFNPGTYQQDPQKWTLLQNVLYRHQQENNPNYNPDLYIRGVVNQDIPQLTTSGRPAAGDDQSAASLNPVTADASPVSLFTSGSEPPVLLSHAVLVPHNIKEQFHEWEQELLGASMVNIHSKVIVLDPFGDNPVVMTGSHNLGFKASNANDDNLVIIEGNAPLAAAYAANDVIPSDEIPDSVRELRFMPTTCNEDWFTDQIQVLIQKLVKAAGINTEQMPDYENLPTHGAGPEAVFPISFIGGMGESGKARALVAIEVCIFGCLFVNCQSLP